MGLFSSAKDAAQKTSLAISDALEYENTKAAVAWAKDVAKSDQLSQEVILRNFLSIPRTLILLFLFLLGLTGVIVLITGNSPIPGLMLAIIGGLLFYFVKSSNFLLPSDKQVQLIDNISKTAITKTKELAEKAANDLESQRLKAEKKKEFIEDFRKRSTREPFEFVVLGGSGWEQLTGEKHIISIDAEKIYIGNLSTLNETAIPIDDVIDLDISGPGKVTSDAGISGGGFGVEGALKGIAIATVVNLLTTHSSTKTIIRIGYQKSEIAFITSQMDLEQARLYFSGVFVRIKSRSNANENPISISGELMKLSELKNSGALTDNEFIQAKAKILAEQNSKQ